MMLITVIIPAYNVSTYILKTLDSLANQTVNNFEVIIVNDGSTDNTRYIVERYIENNQLLKKCMLINKENGGVSSARNCGINCAKGDYLFFIDGDDFIEKTLIEKLINLTSSSEIDLLYWSYEMVDEKGIILSKKENLYEKIATGFELLGQMYSNEKLWLSVCCLLFNTEIIKKNKLSFNEKSCNGEDQEFIFSYLLIANKCQCVTHTYSYYVQRNSSISYSYNIHRFDVIFSFNNMLKLIYENKISDKKLVYAIKKNYYCKSFFYNLHSLVRVLYNTGLSPSTAQKKIFQDYYNTYNTNLDSLLSLENMPSLKDSSVFLKVCFWKISKRIYFLYLYILFILSKRLA